MLVVKNPSANAGDVRDSGLIPKMGRSPEEGNGNLPLVLFLTGKFHGQEPGGLQPMGPQKLVELFPSWDNIRSIKWTITPGSPGGHC